MLCDSRSRGQNLMTQETNCVLNILLTPCSRFMCKWLAQERLLWEEARGCPVQDTARPKTHTVEHSWVPQPSWKHFWENMFKNRNTRVRGKWRRNISMEQQINPAAHAGCHSGAQGYSWRNWNPWRAHIRAEQRHDEEERQRDTFMYWLQPPCHSPSELAWQGGGYVRNRA